MASSNPFTDPADAGLEMDEFSPRLSTETQRRNGYRGSNAADHSTRILENIRDGSYTCSICTDRIRHGSYQDNYVWQCRQCHSVFHYNCVNTWAKASGERRLGNLSQTINLHWTCPNCSADQEAAPGAGCWCGKESAPMVTNNDTPNACFNTCQAQGKCSHQRTAICRKACHPGPCKWECEKSCPRTVLKGPSSWDKSVQRFRNQRKGTPCFLVFTLFCILTLVVGWSTFSVFYSKWRAQPYKYPKYNQKNDLGILGGLFGIIPSTVLLARLVTAFMKKIWDLAVSVLNFNDKSTKAGQKSCAKLFGSIFISLFGIIIVITPLLLFLALPSTMWYFQMRNSCDGFDTRIKMDRYTPYKSTRDTGRSYCPGSRYVHHSLVPSVKDKVFFLGPQFDIVPNSERPYQHFYRYSSGENSTSPKHTAVDVDLYHNLWRIVDLNEDDAFNTWSSAPYLTSSPTFPYGGIPKFPQPIPILVKNGTFTSFGEKKLHMQIPELSLQIADLHAFADSNYREPFLRVFNTAGKSQKEIEMQAIKEWNGNGKADKEIVMRTASFGHGLQQLHMCVREGQYAPDPSQEEVQEVGEGMVEDLLVPMAIISAVRKRIAETERRCFNC